MHVPYKGSGPATAAVVAGEVDLTFTSQAGALPFYKAKRVTALAITGKAPSPLFPGVPTIEAAGVKNYEAGDWIGILAPAGTPKPIIARLNTELAKWLKQPETKARLAQLAFEARSSTPDEFGALIRSELAKWNRTAKAANIKAE
jgi:tripartite-type tricarboxylate transporter receptor subunit TctC